MNTFLRWEMADSALDLLGLSVPARDLFFWCVALYLNRIILTFIQSKERYEIFF